MALALILFGSAGGRLVAVQGSGVDLGAMNVTLVSASDFAPLPDSAPSGELRVLLARLDTGEAPVLIDTDKPASDVARLLHRLEADERRSQAAQKPSQSQPLRAALQDGRDDADARAAGSPGRDRSAGVEVGSSAGLWGVVRPCWRETAGVGAVPVTLEVSLDGGGRLSTPPKIIRSPSAAVNEPRLRSEAQALAALAACMPRGDLRFADRTYRLDFNRAR